MSARLRAPVREHRERRVSVEAVPECGPGASVVEAALSPYVHRTAAVRALTATRVLLILEGDFDRLVTHFLSVSREPGRATNRRKIDLRHAA